MKISVIGTGYVGLVTGTCLAEVDNQVSCVDIDVNKVESMKAGKIPIYEPGLEEIFKRNIADKRLRIDLIESVKDAEVIFLALPTPSGSDGSADLSYVLDVAQKLGDTLDHYCVVVDKSTVPVGTAEKVEKLVNTNGKVTIDIVSNPEFLREGFAVDDFMNPDRIVIGSSSSKARKIMGELYEPFVMKGGQVIYMDERSAEITKYAANSFLATKITFMNEIANLCEVLGANVDNVRLGIGSDDRIGKRFLFPGIGYGGSCFPKDVRALQKTASDSNYDFKILEAVTDANKHQTHVLFEKLNKFYEGKLEGKQFAMWGLAFKPDTDDIREAPALYLIDDLLSAGAKIVAYDPEAANNVKQLLKDKEGITIVDDKYDTLNESEALLITTEWSVFRTPDFKDMKSRLNKPIIFDGRNIYDLDEIKDTGFYYESIGRKIINKETVNG